MCLRVTGCGVCHGGFTRNVVRHDLKGCVLLRLYTGLKSTPILVSFSMKGKYMSMSSGADDR